MKKLLALCTSVIMIVLLMFSGNVNATANDAALNISEAETFIRELLRGSEGSGVTWRLGVWCEDGNLVAGARQIWDLDANDEDVFVFIEDGLTILARVTVQNDYDEAEPAEESYVYDYIRQIFDFLSGREFAEGYVVHVRNPADMLTLQNGIVYFGRPTCPHCVPFADELYRVATETQTLVFYYNSDNWRNHEGGSPVLSRFGVAGVPSLFQVVDGEITHINAMGEVWQHAFIQPTEIMRLVVDSTIYTLRGEEMESDVAPFIDRASGRTMIPLGIVASGLDVPARFDSATRTVYITHNGEEIPLVIDEPLPRDMGTPVIVNDRTFVPARYVSWILGASVRWDPDARAVYVYM